MLQNLDKYWCKTIVYEYNPGENDDVTRSGFEALRDNEYLEAGAIFVSNGVYKFKFVPSEDCDSGEGCIYRCDNCTDTDPELIPTGDEETDYFEEVYNFDHCGLCEACRLNEFKKLLRRDIIKAAAWSVPGYDDHNCIFCDKAAVLSDVPRDHTDKRTFACNAHMNTSYVNKSAEQSLKCYLETQHKEGLKKYQLLMNFLQCPLPKVIDILKDSKGNVVLATLKED